MEIKMSWKRIEPQENLVNQENLDDIVLNIVDEDIVQEGMGKLISLGVLTFLLGSSGVVNAGQFKQELGKVAKDKQVEQGERVTVTKQDITDAVEKSKVEDPKIGKWRRSQILNIVAKTLYDEDRSEGPEGLRRIMTVIWNRAGGNVEKMADECLRESQFSGWNDISGKTPMEYSLHFPKAAMSNPKSPDGKAWKLCLRLANDAINGDFVPDPQIGNRNIYSQKKDNQKAKDTWGKLCDLKIGVHTFGYDRSQDGFRKARIAKNKAAAKTKAQVAKTKEYKVKDNDTLWAIAGKDMKKVEQIRQLNGLKSDVIRPGQKLNIPV